MIVSSIITGSYFSENLASDYLLANSKNNLYKVSDGYVYNGKAPNNYILFNKELWRIIKIEFDGSIKIMRNKSIGKMSFDENGVNKWETSSLKNYLNSDYYNSLSNESKKLIKNNTVEIISFDDYIMSNSNHILCGNMDLYFKNESECIKTNYMNFFDYDLAIWTKSLDDVNNSSVYYVGNTYFGDSSALDKYDVFPVVYLKGDIKINGYGSKFFSYETSKR